MKIANVIEEGRFGGPQRWISVIAGRLKDRGLASLVIFSALDSDRFYKELEQRGIEVRRLHLHRLTKEKKHLLNFILGFIPETFSLYRIIKKENIDIVHCHNSWQFKGVIAGKLAGKKVIWHLHETATPLMVNIFFKFLARRFPDAFITAGERVKNYYLSKSGFAHKTILPIQAPVDTAVFDPEKVEPDQRIGASPGLKIVTAGNVNPAKGLEYFVEMAAILNRKYVNLTFFIVGTHFDSQKTYSDRIKGLAKQYDLKNLHFYGLSSDIPAVLKAADIYVCSSIAEASPISVWEAMSMEKAIVSTDVGDVAKFIKNDESGYIVPVKQATALAERVGRLVENADLRKKMGRQARKVAVNNLDVEICVKKHLQLYKEVAGSFKGDLGDTK